MPANRHVCLRRRRCPRLRWEPQGREPRQSPELWKRLHHQRFVVRQSQQKVLSQHPVKLGDGLNHWCSSASRSSPPQKTKPRSSTNTTNCTGAPARERVADQDPARPLAHWKRKTEDAEWVKQRTSLDPHMRVQRPSHSTSRGFGAARAECHQVRTAICSVVHQRDRCAPRVAGLAYDPFWCADGCLFVAISADPQQKLFFV